MSDKKRYSYSCTEEMVLNPDYKGYRKFRLEVFDREQRNAGNAIYEGSFLIPADICMPLIKVFEGYESDLPICITVAGKPPDGGYDEW